jgi:hypothetical protein
VKWFAKEEIQYEPRVIVVGVATGEEHWHYATKTVCAPNGSLMVYDPDGNIVAVYADGFWNYMSIGEVTKK